MAFTIFNGHSWRIQQRPSVWLWFRFQTTLAALFWSLEGWRSDLRRTSRKHSSSYLSCAHPRNICFWPAQLHGETLRDKRGCKKHCSTLAASQGVATNKSFDRIGLRMQWKHLRPSSLHRLYTRCLGWRLRRNLCTCLGSKPLPPRLSKPRLIPGFLSSISII